MTAVMFEAPEDLGDVGLVDQADAPDVGTADADAPYGVNPRTGKPYTRPKEWRDKMAAALAAGRATQAQRAGHKPPQRTKAKPSTAGKGAASRAPGIDYRPSVVGLAAAGSLLCGVLARTTGNQAFALDGLTLRLHAPGLAEAAHEAAMFDSRFASWLDHLTAWGPYTALGGVLIAVGAQMAANHRVIEPSPEMGILSAEDLIAAVLPEPAPA